MLLMMCEGEIHDKYIKLKPKCKKVKKRKVKTSESDSSTDESEESSESSLLSEHIKKIKWKKKKLKKKKTVLTEEESSADSDTESSSTPKCKCRRKKAKNEQSLQFLESHQCLVLRIVQQQPSGTAMPAFPPSTIADIQNLPTTSSAPKTVNVDLRQLTALVQYYQ